MTPHPLQTLVFLVALKLLFAYLGLYISLQVIKGVLTMAKAKSRHIVKDAASGLYFVDLSSDEQVVSVSTQVEDARQMDSEHHAAVQAALLTHAQGNFAWVPDFA